MESSSFIGLVNNAALLLALVLVYDAAGLRKPRQDFSPMQVVTGLVLGVIGVLIMLTPWQFTPGVVFDTRSILLSITGLFFGTLPTLIVILFTGIYRFFLGGPGVWTGIGVIATSGAVGLIWRHWIKKHMERITHKDLYLMGFTTHVLMLLWMLTLPDSVALDVLSAISLPVILIFPLGTLLLGRLFLHRQDRFKAVEALQKSQQELKEALLKQNQAIRAGNVGFWDWDLIANKVYYSAEWKKQIGYDDHEISDDYDEWKKRVHPEDLEPTLERINRSIADEEENHAVEFRFRHRDGSYRWIMAQASVLHDNDGTPIRMLGSHIDITDRKNTEQQSIILKTAIDQAPVGIALADDKIHIYYCNPEALKMQGGTSEDIDELRSDLYRNWQILKTNGEEYEIEHLPLVRAIRNNETIREEFILRDKDGADHICDGFACPVLVNDKIIGGMVIFLDITERKVAEEQGKTLQRQLQQAMKTEAIGTLAGGIAHDFNNILGAILGYADMAYDDCPKNTAMAKYIQQIIVAGNRARELVSQILAFSRQTATEQLLLDPLILVKEILKLLQSTLPATITIHQDIAHFTRGHILANPTQFHQVLMNICTNAFHAMEESGGILTISLKKVRLGQQDTADMEKVVPGDFMKLSVADTGLGIPQAIQDKIFDPYFTTKEVGKGTGMGLSIAHGIVMSYGGFIRCESEVGKGSVFHIFIPLADESDNDKDDEKSADSISTSNKNEHILVVDDEKPLAEMLQSMLERLGYQVTIHTNSLEALATFKQEPEAYDLVITDQTMPGMTGFDLARRILELRPHMPIILCTGFSNIISEEKAKSAGIQGFAMKPITRKNMAALISKLLSDHLED